VHCKKQTLNYYSIKILEIKVASSHAFSTIYTKFFLILYFCLNRPFYYTRSTESVHSVNDMMTNKCGAIGGRIIGRGNSSTWEKLALVPCFPPKIAHNQIWKRNRTAVEDGRRLTACGMARPTFQAKHPHSSEQRIVTRCREKVRLEIHAQWSIMLNKAWRWDCFKLKRIYQFFS
jgi:hypothetical protein